jgi:DNA-directed RNA polymerase specialized sigma24 family protein
MWNTDFVSKDDLQLAVFIEERNQQSMDHFYDKYSPALYGIIYRITNNEHLAEECLTATFVKAWNEIAAFRRSGASLFTWLLNIARQSAFEVITQEKERNPGINNSVNGHNQPYSAFELVYFKGLSVMQAAELSGITLMELTTNLRLDLKNMKDKKEEHDQ